MGAGPEGQPPPRRCRDRRYAGTGRFQSLNLEPDSNLRATVGIQPKLKEPPGGIPGEIVRSDLVLRAMITRFTRSAAMAGIEVPARGFRTRQTGAHRSSSASRRSAKGYLTGCAARSKETVHSPPAVRSAGQRGSAAVAWRTTSPPTGSEGHVSGEFGTRGSPPGALKKPRIRSRIPRGAGVLQEAPDDPTGFGGHLQKALTAASGPTLRRAIPADLPALLQTFVKQSPSFPRGRESRRNLTWIDNSLSL